MMLNLRVAVVSLVLLAGVAACGAEAEPKVTPTHDRDTPCLVTVAELQEITGIAQTIHEVDVPGGGLGTQLSCETTLDERDVSMDWSLQEPGMDPPPTHEEQRSLVDDPGMKPQQADLGGGQSGWVSAGRPIGLAEAQVVTLLDDLMLYVTVTSTDDDSPLPISQIKGEALALARAVVAARAA